MGEHPNIIKVEDIFYNPAEEFVHIVMEFAGQGSDLKKLLK